MIDPQPFKLPQRLNNEFDRMIIKRFREWENIEKKIATFQNHLHFTLHCKHHGIFPSSLTLKCALKGKRVNNILIRAQRALTNERINRINHRLIYFINIRSDIDEFMFFKLPADYYDAVKKWMGQAHRTHFNNICLRHRAKFEVLQRKHQQSNQDDDTIVPIDQEEKNALMKKWVINLSDRPLTQDETSLLQKGLNFAVTPKTTPINEYIIGIETACKLLGPDSKQAETLRADCVKIVKNTKLPKPNIPKGELNALHTLAKEPEITILPADKGRSVVVMNTSDYKNKANALLSDTSTYHILTKDPTAKFSNTLIKKLQELKKVGALTDFQYRRLYPTSTTIPRFYGLPKVHKSGAPLRPIVASRGSITYPVARFLADILAPLVGKNGYALKNSADLVKQFGDCKLEEEDVLVSFDVTALFTQVPVDKSIDVIHDKLAQDTSLKDRTLLSPIHIRDLLNICLKTTYFLYDGVIYTQVEGAAMGSPISPIVANLFMEWFEENALNTFKYEITIWRRYIDDTMVALCEDLIEDLTQHINSIHPAIKFTREEESNNKIAMLDTKFTRSPAGTLTFSVYRKPTHTDQYLQFDSNQPLQHKLGVIKTLHHRCNTICSNEEAKLQELEHLQKVLSISGYTRSAWVTATRPKSKAVPSTRKDRNIKGSITLPYVGNMSNAIARTIRKAGVSVHLRPHNTIRGSLVHPKDKVNKEEKAGVVYHIKCSDCNSNYVGETERRLCKRIKEHRQDSSPIAQHTVEHNHSFSELPYILEYKSHF